jgi:hypothetical protein
VREGEREEERERASPAPPSNSLEQRSFEFEHRGVLGERDAVAHHWAVRIEAKENDGDKLRRRHGEVANGGGANLPRTRSRDCGSGSERYMNGSNVTLVLPHVAIGHTRVLLRRPSGGSVNVRETKHHHNHSVDDARKTSTMIERLRSSCCCHRSSAHTMSERPSLSRTST